MQKILSNQMRSSVTFIKKKERQKKKIISSFLFTTTHSQFANVISSSVALVADSLAQPGPVWCFIKIDIENSFISGNKYSKPTKTLAKSNNNNNNRKHFQIFFSILKWSKTVKNVFLSFFRPNRYFALKTLN